MPAGCLTRSFQLFILQKRCPSRYLRPQLQRWQSGMHLRQLQVLPNHLLPSCVPLATALHDAVDFRNNPQCSFSCKSCNHIWHLYLDLSTQISCLTVCEILIRYVKGNCISDVHDWMRVTWSKTLLSHFNPSPLSLITIRFTQWTLSLLP